MASGAISKRKLAAYAAGCLAAGDKGRIIEQPR